jgi:hypothetical protein
MVKDQLLKGNPLLGLAHNPALGLYAAFAASFLLIYSVLRMLVRAARRRLPERGICPV